VEVEHLYAGEVLRLERIEKVVIYVSGDIGAREAKRQIEQLHDGEAPPRVGYIRHADIGDAAHYALVRLCCAEERAARMVGDLHPPVGAFLDLVAELLIEDRHLMGRDEIRAVLQLDDRIAPGIRRGRARRKKSQEPQKHHFTSHNPPFAAHCFVYFPPCSAFLSVPHASPPAMRPF